MIGADTNINIAIMQSWQNGHANAVSKASHTNVENLQEIEEAARDFEAVFISEMIKPMFEGISTEAPFGGGKGEEIFRGLMIQEYGKRIVEAGGIGIADHVMEEMIKLQERNDNVTTTAR